MSRHESTNTDDSCVEQKRIAAKVDRILKLPKAHVRARRLRALGASMPLHTVDALLSRMTARDSALRRRACSALYLFRDALPARTSVIAHHLQTHPDEQIRATCACLLLWSKSPEVTRAYIRALADPFDKLVQVACVALSDSRNRQAPPALRKLFKHSNWRVRLGACQALIKLNAVDAATITVLERMCTDGQAAVYDAEVEDFQDLFRELWGGNGACEKFQSFLDQARRIYNRNRT